MDYETLEATVVEIAPDNMDEEEEQATVPLIELHPLCQQENAAVNVEATHTGLERLRFFHQFLLLPWDSDSQEDWFEVHLPIRVKMYGNIFKHFKLNKNKILFDLKGFAISGRVC